MPRSLVARKNIPNLLTMLRLVLAGVFFVLLAQYRFNESLYALLLPAVGLFIAAALTDALDGYLARRWSVESKFGRIMDPFCDKVLILGALCFLAGPGYEYEAWVQGEDNTAVREVMRVTGVLPWMVVVILARELLVTGIRGELEGSGHKFGANIWGKLKMILQSVVVPAVLLIVYLIDSGMYEDDALYWTRDILVYATVIVTVFSGLPYVTGAYRVTKADRDATPKSD